MTSPDAPRGLSGSRDPGLQPERTSLAWRRTVFSVIVCDLLIGRSLVAVQSQSHTGPSAAIVAAAAIAAFVSTVFILACFHRRARSLRRSTDVAPVAVMRIAMTGVVALSTAVLLAMTVR